MDTTRDAPPKAPHLRFLEKVHGYVKPPSVRELSHLAALLADRAGPATTPQELVDLAARLWDAAAMKRQEMDRSMSRTLAQFDARSILYGPLKVGSHFMPRIDWDKEGTIIPCRRFLEQVVGLSREEDRMMWWRAYLTAKIRRLRHRDRWGAIATAEHRAHPEWCGPDDFPIDGRLVEEAISSQRREGFQKGFPASSEAEGFRLWRLEMKAPDQRAEKPLSAEDSSRNALEGK